MDKELHAVICPHPPLLLPNMGHKNHLEIYPIRIDSIVYIVVRFYPVSVHVTRIGLLRAEDSVDKNVLDTSRPKRFDGSPQAL
jgi:hypothetical protein